MNIVGLESGSAIIIDGYDRPNVDTIDYNNGTLMTPADILSWIGDAVAAGITFDVLKTIGVTLVAKGWKKGKALSTAEDVKKTIDNYLRSCGYFEIRYTEIKHINGEGWALSGQIDGKSLKSLTDESGQIIYVRIK
jgi:hypothetical protein